MNQIKRMAVLVIFFTGFSFIQDEELSKSMARGKDVYGDFCIVCHKTNGEGTEKIFPPLAKSDFLKKYRDESIRSVKFGQKGNIKVNGVDYNGTMPVPGLTDEEIVDVMNYIMNSWGNKSDKIVTISEVKSLIK
jgi:mono/diheme cytochrome c family protein